MLIIADIVIVITVVRFVIMCTCIGEMSPNKAYCIISDRKMFPKYTQGNTESVTSWDGGKSGFQILSTSCNRSFVYTGFV